MNDEKIEVKTTIEANAENAAKLEKEVLAKPDESTYTHVFKKPFTYRGQTYERLTFDWGSLGGADSLAVEKDIRHEGVTLVLPAFTGEYLAGMAARACTERNEDGFRVITSDTILAMPLRDFMAISNKMRNFLIHAESEPETGAAG